MAESLPDDWLLPQWPAPPWVRAVCTSRNGGVSAAPYDSLNLGDHVGDDPADVAANRAVLARALGVRPVFLQQVHGQGLVALSGRETSGPQLQADACISRNLGLACTILVADCLPVLFTDRRGSFVAAAHAGWRGLAGGVLEAVISHLCAPGGLDPADLLVWLGPCIGPLAFEVGGEVKAAFEAYHPRAADCFVATQQPDKWLANLPALARQRLAASGVQQVFGNDGQARWCTVSQPSRFFSHRRDGVSGRFAACIWLT